MTTNEHGRIFCILDHALAMLLEEEFDDFEAETLRDLMDRHWAVMTEADRTACRKFSVDSEAIDSERWKRLIPFPAGHAVSQTKDSP